MTIDIDVLKMIGLIAIGIVIGMALSWIFIFISVDSVVNNIIPKIHIENINFEFNETELVKGVEKLINKSEEIK
jgi:hypothetical protein